jgi:MFS family permease
MTVHERAPFLGFAAVALLLPVIGIKIGLLLTFALLVCQGLGGGFTANAWTSMISKIIPPESRGTFFGLQSGLANLFISVSAVGAGYLLDYFDAPWDFASCFLLAAVFFVVSWFALAATREPEDTEKFIPERKTHFWDDSKRVLWRDKNFDWFLTARVLSQFASMGFAFHIIYALREFNMTKIESGYLIAALTISQTVANVGMGWFGDKVGHRLMLIIGAAAAFLAAALAWSATSLAWFYPIFILEGVANVAIWTNSISMTVDFGSETDRPIYIGLSQTLTAPAAIIAPLIGGWIVDAAGFALTFAASALLALGMFSVLTFLVKEPRKFKS